MKKLFFGAIFLVLAISAPIPAMAGVSVRIGVALPPPIVFSAPPEVILLPHTGVYVAPDVAADLFFFDGWWWRPWNGHWYRSQNYRSGWAYYEGIPVFHDRVPPRWRDDYHGHRWDGHEWNYQRISHPELQQIWQRKLRKQSRPQPGVGPRQDRPQHLQTVVRPAPPGRPQHREMGRSPQPGPQRHQGPQHGGPEGRR